MAETVVTPVVAVTDCPIFSGPFKTERLGAALGVDLGSQDLALAVSRDNRMPRASVVVTTAARNMIRISKAGEKIEAVVVYGSAVDPTQHPDFREIAENVRDLRNKWFSKAKLCLATDEPRLEDAEQRHVLTVFDKVFARFEWGTAKTYTAMTGKKSADYNALATTLTGIDRLIVQARFQKGGEVDTASEAEVKAWIKKVQELKPIAVHILQADAKSGAKKAKSAPKSRLVEIAAEFTEKTGIPAEIFVNESLLAT